ncbi:MAG TPA: uroporphyrinogen-III C-methyltransferase [Deltaproteobacteria bacterium]|nr:uroporphyrinogen-III C-methyltransferase [Deltaproteobacteria bacterium]
MQKGIVYLVGAGPGDPSLMTLRGVECLRRADVVVYDYLANEQLLNHAPPAAERIYAGKVGGRHNQEQEEISDLLVGKAREGKTVVRLKGGDPLVFGRGGEECQALKEAGLAFEVVPGITAAIGAGAYAGIPLTHRDFTTSVTLVSGHEGGDGEDGSIDWERLGHDSGTLVFYMGISNLRQNMGRLVDHGRSPRTPVALVRWGTTMDQQVLTGILADIADLAEQHNFKPPAVTIVGEVVSLRETLRWFDTRPLFGRSILITRAADQAGEFAGLLAERGAKAIECPTILMVEPESWAPLDAAIARISEYDWLVLTSANAVRYFFKRLDALGLDARALSDCRVCAVGPGTAEALHGFGVRADLIPDSYKAEGVAAAFAKLDIKGDRVLFPRADHAREVIPHELGCMGALVDSPVAYCNVMPGKLPPEAVFELEKRAVDCITFTSSSTVRNLAAMLGEDRMVDMLRGVAVASIGPVTSKTCRALGLKVDIEPAEYTLPALADAIEAFLLKSGADSLE